MSSRSAHAAAGSERKQPTSLLAALNKMQWDTAMAITMASDSYYHYGTTKGLNGKRQQQPAGRGEAVAASAHWFRRYVVSSSATRLCIHAASVGYVAYVLTHPSRYVPCTISIAPTQPSATTVTEAVTNPPAAAVPTAAPPTIDCYVYQGAEGMQLLMKEKMPRWAVLLHAIAGTLLLPLGLTQKESVFYMQLSKKAVLESTTDAAAPHTRVEEVRAGDAKTHSAAKKVQLHRAKASRRRHGSCGFMTVGSVFIMVAGGVSLRNYSIFSDSNVSKRAGLLNFASAMFLFAAPWVALAPATAASGKNSKAVAHALFGNLLVKAILAVPFERVLGGLWQRVEGVRVALPRRRWWPSGGGAAAGEDVRIEVTQQVEGALERVYYKSIVATTVVFGLWGVMDIVRFVRLAKKCMAADDKVKASA